MGETRVVRGPVNAVSVCSVPAPRLQRFQVMIKPRSLTVFFAADAS
jgi:hypothetical protein